MIKRCKDKSWSVPFYIFEFKQLITISNYRPSKQLNDLEHTEELASQFKSLFYAKAIQGFTYNNGREKSRIDKFLENIDETYIFRGNVVYILLNSYTKKELKKKFNVYSPVVILTKKILKVVKDSWNKIFWVIITSAITSITTTLITALVTYKLLK